LLGIAACSESRSTTIADAGADATDDAGPTGFVAEITADAESQYAPTWVDFSAAITGGTPPYSVVWQLGDGSEESGTEARHLYPAPGTYQVTVAITDDDGATATCVSAPSCALEVEVLEATLAAVPACDMTSGRVWPAAHGDVCLCPWKDDKLAAISITIDDNTAPEHDWWIAQGETHDFRFTWFVITERIGTGDFWGTWQQFADLHSLGHDVQSHTVSHLSGNLTIEEEYRDSQLAIEANIPGIEVPTLAYPGGTNSHLNDPAVAAQYYVGARGTVGHQNPIGNTDYMNTNSVSSFVYQTDHWASITNLTQYDAAHPGSYMAWQCMHFHGVSSIATEVADGLAYIKAHEADLWMGLFREVALYGQERDGAQVFSQVDPDEVRLRITDDLDDDTFDFPLTVKVRLDAAWTDVAASQSGASIPVELVDHDGAPYALAQVRPDGGDVILSRTDE
jgi:hypothetical protein